MKMLKNFYLRSTASKVPWDLISVKYCSQDIKAFKSPNVSCLKRGSGGRSSFNGNVVTVFGATGFIGPSVVNQLAKRGSQIIIPYRCDADDPKLKALKVAGDLGQILFQPFHLKDPLSIRKAIKYSNIVINLIGAHYETKNFDLFAVNGRGAAEIAKACREMNIERLIHFSSLNLTEHPEKYVFKKCNFYPSKLQGERAVLEEFPDATIFRPSSVYGQGDSFLWPLMAPGRILINLPLYAKGKKTTKVPVVIYDVSAAVVAAIEYCESKGKIYQAIGPERFYLRDIANFCLKICQWSSTPYSHISEIRGNLFFLTKYFFFFYFQSSFFVRPKYNLNFNLIEMESTTDVVDHSLPTLSDLGISVSKFDDIAPGIIVDEFSKADHSLVEIGNYQPTESISNVALQV